MARSVFGCVAVLAVAYAIRIASDASFAYWVAFAAGMLTVWTGAVRVGAPGAGPDAVGTVERVGVRTASGLLAVLALATIHWTRYGEIAGGAQPALEILQNVLAASLGAALLMRLPLLVALGNEPLVSEQGES